MSRRQMPEPVTEERDAAATPSGDVHTILASMREEMSAALGAQFDALEREVSRRLAERLASADALIARLSEENARLAAENERHERMLTKLRELAQDGT